MRRFSTHLALSVLLGMVSVGGSAAAQGLIYGTGQGSTPGGRDSNWKIVAYPSAGGSNSFTPPDGQTAPYAAYVPTDTPGVFVGGGEPQSGVDFNGVTNYWISPQSTTDSLVPGTYNWIVAQPFTVATTQLYRFNFQGAGDNELEFYIDGTVDWTDPKRPTITGGTQIGGRAGGYNYITNFTGGATVTSGSHTAYMVLWDYGGATAALIGQSSFIIPTQYWAPSGGAGGNGTWYGGGGDTAWSVNSAGSGTKTTWEEGNVGIARFGGTAGEVQVSGFPAVSQLYFDTTGYTLTGAGGGGGGSISYTGSAPSITIGSGKEATIGVGQQSATGLTVTGGGTATFTGPYQIDGGNLVASGNATVIVNTANFGSGGYASASGGRLTVSSPFPVSQDVSSSTGGVSTIAPFTNAASATATSGGTTIVSANSTVNSATVNSGGTLVVDGSVFNPVDVQAGGNLRGSGVVGGSVSGGGNVNPGNSPGILTTPQVNPSGGLDFTFEFSGTAPNYASGTASVNDVLRLTDLSSPFTSALTSANSKTLFLNFTKSQLTLGGSNAITTLTGGFFTDIQADFTSFLNNNYSSNGGFAVYVLGDGAGTDNSLNGQGYYNWRNPAMFGWEQSLFLSTTPVEADFGAGTVNGQVMTLVVGVPEPSTYAMGICGAGFLGLVQWSRRRGNHKTRKNPSVQTLGTRPAVAISLAVLAALSVAAPQARAQIATGTLFGTGQGVGPGSLDPYWNIVAVPAGFTPPSSLPYAAYVPTNAEPVFLGGVPART